MNNIFFSSELSYLHFRFDFKKMITNAIDFALDWYYGSSKEHIVSNCVLGEEYKLPVTSLNTKNKHRVVRKGKFVDGTAVNVYSVHGKDYINTFKTNVKVNFNILRLKKVYKYCKSPLLKNFKTNIYEHNKSSVFRQMHSHLNLAQIIPLM